MAKNFSEHDIVFMIGAAKSGTTTIHKILMQDPQICCPIKKENSFFAEDELYANGMEYYESLFNSPNENTKVILDSSTPNSRFTIFPHVPERIHRAFPQAKFIYIMRHPVDRAFAHYKHRWLREVHPEQPFTETFEEFVAHDPMCVDDSLYKSQVEHYLQYFPIDRFFFALNEDLAADTLGLIQKICAHMGIDCLPEIYNETTLSRRYNDSQKIRQNVVKQKLKKQPIVQFARNFVPSGGRDWLYRQFIAKTSLVAKQEEAFTPLPMKPETRKQLIEGYQEHIAWVENLLGRQLPHWYK